MTTQDCRYTGMPWVSPYVCVIDVDQSIDFYKKAFGFELFAEPSKNEEKESIHCELKYKDCMVMIGKEGAHDKTVKAPLTSNVESPISLYFYCEDVDFFCTAAKKAGAIVVTEPEDTFWGDRMCRLKDPNGYVWAFATHKPQE